MSYNDKKIDAITKVAETTIKWFAISFISVQISKGFVSLAGELTVANIQIALTSNIDKSLPSCDNLAVFGGFSLISGIVGLIYGKNQRKLRLQKTSQLSGHILQLEQIIDKKRSSSEITKTGQTPE